MISSFGFDGNLYKKRQLVDVSGDKMLKITRNILKNGNVLHVSRYEFERCEQVIQLKLFWPVHIIFVYTENISYLMSGPVLRYYRTFKRNLVFRFDLRLFIVSSKYQFFKSSFIILYKTLFELDRNNFLRIVRFDSEHWSEWHIGSWDRNAIKNDQLSTEECIIYFQR